MLQFGAEFEHVISRDVKDVLSEFKHLEIPPIPDIFLGKPSSKSVSLCPEFKS